ncbi:MAG: hypothetical protein U0793_05360 [Gemmataceae bacterium]
MRSYRVLKDIVVSSTAACVACHTEKFGKAAGALVLDDERMVNAQNPAGLGFGIRVPGTYARLAADTKGEYGYKPLHKGGWSNLAASRYIRLMQSRRSLLVWKLYGKRLDGWDNEDLPYEAVPGDPTSLRRHGKPAPDTAENRRLAHIGFTGGPMPPPDAVVGSYVAPDGRKIKVPALTDEEKRTVVRWIDLGCPIDLSGEPGRGWALDDQRPTLTLTYPRAGNNESFSRVLIGMHDYGAGLDMKSFHVSADFAVNGIGAGKNLADQFRMKSDGVWELTLTRPMTKLASGVLTVSVQDGQGNVSRIDRRFSVK